MLGYMTKQKAKDSGFTHAGNYYFIPVYFGLDPELGLCVLPKWRPFYFLMSVVSAVEVLMWKISMRNGDPEFEFRVTSVL